MFKKLWEVTSLLFTLTRDLRQFQQEQKEIKQELRDLTIMFHLLAQDVKNAKEKTEQRHENLLLEIDNRLLKAERVLQPGSRSSSKKPSKK